jgi:hypothetical protein
MSAYWVLALNFTGTKAIIAYIIVIVVIVAVLLYMRQNTARR